MFRMNANTSERLVLAGERKSGQSVRSENVTAVSAIANIVKVSFSLLQFFGDISFSRTNSYRTHRYEK